MPNDTNAAAPNATQTATTESETTESTTMSSSPTMMVDRAVSPDPSVEAAAVSAANPPLNDNDNPNPLPSLDKHNRSASTAQMMKGLLETDITCSKNKALQQNHPGNILFRQRVQKVAAAYQNTTSRAQKMAMVQKLLDELAHNNCRFVKYEEGAWVEASEPVAREKVGHALRFAIRREHKQREKIQEKMEQRHQRMKYQQLYQEQLQGQRQQAQQQMQQRQQLQAQQELQEQQMSSTLVSPQQASLLTTPAPPVAAPLATTEHRQEAEYEYDPEEDQEPEVPQTQDCGTRTMPPPSDTHHNNSELSAFSLFYCVQRKMVKQPPGLVVHPEIEHQLSLIIRERWEELSEAAKASFQRRAEVLSMP